MPKTIRNQFDKYLTYEKLLEAHNKARKGKNRKPELIKFNLKQEEYIKFAQEKYSNGETSMQYFEEYLQPNALYLLDEPEVSLSPSNQVLLANEINKLARLLECQFVIATHSPFMLGTLNAKIYNIDTKEYDVVKWNELENVQYFYNFFKKHEQEFEEVIHESGE